jgi:hypothetical protein
MSVSYTTDRPCALVGHPIGALALICLWNFLKWLTYAYVMLCQDDVTPGEFYFSNVYANTSL